MSIQQVLNDAKQIVTTNNTTVQGVLLFLALLALSGLVYLFLQWKDDQKKSVALKDAIIKAKDLELQKLNDRIEHIQKERFEDLKYFDKKVVSYIEKIADDVKTNQGFTSQLKDAIAMLHATVNEIKGRISNG